VERESEPFGFHKIRGISEELLVSEQELFSVELVTITIHFSGARHKFPLILISCSDLNICVIF